MHDILSQLIAAGVPEDKAHAIAEQAISLAKAQPTDEPDVTKLAKSLGDLRDAFAAQAREEAHEALSEELDGLQKALDVSEGDTFSLGQLMDSVLDLVKDADARQADAMERVEAKQDALCKALENLGEHVELIESFDSDALTTQLEDVSKALNLPIRKSVGSVAVLSHPGDSADVSDVSQGQLRAVARRACLDELAKGGDTLDRTRQFVLSQAINRLNTPGTDVNAVLSGVGMNTTDLVKAIQA